MSSNITAIRRRISVDFSWTAIRDDSVELDQGKVVPRYITYVHNTRGLLICIYNMRHGGGVNFCGYLQQI
jgi:hypothetical protein